MCQNQNDNLCNDMKRVAEMNLEYDKSLKKVNLVERNPNPSGTRILSLNKISIHESKDIIELANQIQHADDAIKNSACGKLTVILEQIKFLQSQAQKILKESEQSNNLHHAACNFKKVPGKVYHLYKRKSDQIYFSMLSPEEWGSSCTHEYLGSFRLEHDQSWTPIDKINKTDEALQWAENLLTSSKNRNTFAIDKITDMEI